MSRRGPKGKPPELKVVAGTDQPCRRRVRLVAAVVGSARKPSWVKGLAAKLWREKVAAYEARGQSVVGCESALAQFCALEAALIAQFVAEEMPPTSQINAYRSFAAEFFDTPASQVGKIQKPKDSKFSGNGQRPVPPKAAGHA
jgi:hypothetical protein